MNCPNCQFSNPAGARFCLNCGAALTPPPAPQGERRFVTVLFADVVDSTPMGERLDPEQIAEIMNGAFALFNPAVTQYGGTVARLMGDAVLAIFGAPIAHEDDAERAIHAALAIQQAAASYARTVQSTYGVDFRVRVGINSGLAVLTMVGNDVKMEYTAMGDTANVAARMQSAATPGTVLISADTYHLVRNIFDVKAREPIEVKGKSAPMESYEVVAARPTRDKLRGLEGIMSPVVGRDAELTLLRGQITRLTDAQGAFISVVGEAGLGKSRLLAELRTWATALSAAPVWLEGRALSYGQSIAYYPWRQAVRQAIGASETDPAPTVLEKLSAACNRLDIADDLPFLSMMLQIGSGSGQDEGQYSEGEALVDGITNAARRFLAASARLAPTTLVFDDLHWADEASLQLLEAVADLVREVPLLITCLLRPERASLSWQTMAHIRQSLDGIAVEIALEPLSAETAHDLLENLLSVEGLPPTVRSLILQKSEGNPFFLEEVIRSLVDSGHIVREDGHWRATGDIVDVSIPDTLAGVLSARIDRLPERTKHVAQTAAVIGRIFPYPVLNAACMEAPPPERIDDPTPHMHTLTEEELVRERAQDPELQYIFKHALTQEAAYDLLLLRTRRDYHRRVGEVIERLYPERLADLAPMLAHHFWQGEDWPRAARFALQAAKGAAGVYARREAVEHYRRAYQALKKLPSSEPQMIVDALLGWVALDFKSWGYEEALERMREAEELARSMDDRASLALVLNWIGGIHLAAGYPSRAFPPLQQGWVLSEALDNDMLTMLPMFLMTSNMVNSDPRGTLQQLDHVIELAEASHDLGIVGHSLAIKAMAHARLGEFEQAEETIGRALEVVARGDSPVREVDTFSLAALTYYDLGNVEKGLEFSRRAVERAQAIQAGECGVFARYCAGVGHLSVPDASAARAVFEDAGTRAAPLGNEVLAMWTRAGTAMASALEGSHSAAEELVDLVEEARGMGDLYTAAVLSQSLGEGYTERGELDRAEGFLEAALDYYRRNEMRPYIARALRSLQTLRKRQGMDADAAELGEQAERLERGLTHVERARLRPPF